MESESRHKAILEFWFEGPDKSWWWAKDTAVDGRIADTFGADLLRAKAGEYDAWQTDPQSCLALIILLDQFSRNIYRDRPQAFAQDAQALSFARAGIAQKIDAQLTPQERVFFYMPLEHSEDLGMQDLSLEKFTQLAREVPPDDTAAYEYYVGFAERHRDIIVNFGRFPHRNRILSRQSTAAEDAFLKMPHSSF